MVSDLYNNSLLVICHTRVTRSIFTMSSVTSPSGSPHRITTVLLQEVPIVCLWIDGCERLCLAQISNTLLKDFSYNEIHNRRVALGITCVQCTPVQLEILRRSGAMPVSSRRCGMITKHEAERLVKSFLEDIKPPKLPEGFAFNVKHDCGWGCKGLFFPSRYNSSRAKCVKCKLCSLFFSANKFIFHFHRGPESTYRHPDAANFNSWRRHLSLDMEGPPEHLLYAWEDVKAMFNGGGRKRIMAPDVKRRAIFPKVHMTGGGSMSDIKNELDMKGIKRLHRSNQGVSPLFGNSNTSPPYSNPSHGRSHDLPLQLSNRSIFPEVHGFLPTSPQLSLPGNDSSAHLFNPLLWAGRTLGLGFSSVAKYGNVYSQQDIMHNNQVTTGSSLCQDDKTRVVASQVNGLVFNQQEVGNGTQVISLSQDITSVESSRCSGVEVAQVTEEEEGEGRSGEKKDIFRPYALEGRKPVCSTGNGV